MKTPTTKSVQNKTATQLQKLTRRLSIHKRRMRYWANLPGFYGPTIESLRKLDEMYELACDDANNIAQEIERLTGKPCEVIDIRKTFQVRWSNPKAPAITLRGESEKTQVAATTPK